MFRRSRLLPPLHVALALPPLLAYDTDLSDPHLDTKCELLSPLRRAVLSLSRENNAAT